MRSRFLTRLSVVLVLSGAASQVAQAAIPEKDASRIEGCRQAILSGQLKGGAIPMVGYLFRGQPALVDVYFGDLTCLGLLSAQAYKPDARSLPYVRRWIEWCATHQAADGSFPRWSGTRDEDGDLSSDATPLPPDSLDSYGSTYLSTVGAYIQASRTLPSARVIAACRKCRDLLNKCRDEQGTLDPDAVGFYWNFIAKTTPSGRPRGQYLLDNIEVHQGWVAATVIFGAVRDAKAAADAAEARLSATQLAGRLHKFWYPEQKYFVALFGDKAAKVAWNVQPSYIESLETVSALAFFNNVKPKTRQDLWVKLMSTHRRDMEVGFTTDDYVNEEPTIERVYFASVRSASAADQGVLLRRLRTRVDEFLVRNQKLKSVAAEDRGLMYPRVHRYRMMIQGLLSQSGGLPAYLPNVPLDARYAP